MERGLERYLVASKLHDGHALHCVMRYTRDGAGADRSEPCSAWISDKDEAIALAEKLRMDASARPQKQGKPTA